MHHYTSEDTRYRQLLYSKMAVYSDPSTSLKLALNWAALPSAYCMHLVEYSSYTVTCNMTALSTLGVYLVCWKAS